MKQFVVIGLGRFGSSVARTLADNGHDVLAIDQCEECVDALVEHVTHAVEADATDEAALSALGVNNFDTAVVSIGDNLHANILATLILKEMGVPEVVAKAQDQMHGKILSRVGADKVVFPERDMGERVARQLISPNMLDYIDFAPGYSIIEIIAPSQMVGKTLQEINFRREYNANVMAIRRGKNLNLAPGGQDKVLEGDTLIIMGHNDELEDLKEE